MRFRYPQPLNAVRFDKNILLLNQLNVSRADISCVLSNGVGGAARSTQPVTLYITVDITPQNLHKSPPSIPTVDGDSPAEEATVPERIQFPVPEHPLSLSHYQPVEPTGNAMPQSREDVLPIGAKDSHLALHLANVSMKRIVPIDGPNTWESAVGKVKWVMDTLSPIAEVRATPFSYLSLAELTSSLSFPHSLRWRSVYFLQFPRHVHL
jgi:hypothetical protein